MEQLVTRPKNIYPFIEICTVPYIVFLKYL